MGATVVGGGTVLGRRPMDGLFIVVGVCIIGAHLERPRWNLYKRHAETIRQGFLRRRWYEFFWHRLGRRHRLLLQLRRTNRQAQVLLTRLPPRITRDELDLRMAFQFTYRRVQFQYT